MPVGLYCTQPEQRSGSFRRDHQDSIAVWLVPGVCVIEPHMMSAGSTLDPFASVQFEIQRSTHFLWLTEKSGVWG